MSSLSRGTDNQGPGGESATPFIPALCEAMLFEETMALLDEAARKKALSAVTEFVQGQLNSLPLLLRILFGFGNMGFRALVCARYFKGFTGLPLEKRSRIVTGFAWGKFALFRQLFRAVRSTAFLAFYETPEARASLESLDGNQPERSPKP